MLKQRSPSQAVIVLFIWISNFDIVSDLGFSA